MSRHGDWKDERGFTLVEVLLVIVLMGVVMAIASSSWFGAIESRKVDSATNQVAAELRLAHSQATNRLANSDFTTPKAGSTSLSTYDIGPSGAVASNSLPEGTQVGAATSIRFKADSSVQVISGPAAVGGIITITIRSSKDATNNHDIRINTTTSRIQVVP